MPNIKTENWNDHQIRFVEKEPGEWWAVAKDVAEALSYSETVAMTRSIDDDLKGVQILQTLGGAQEMAIISEIGLYDAIFRSQHDKAKEFRLWVYEVIKTLRQASGLEGFEIFRLLDKEHQKEAMDRLRNSLADPVKVDYIKANTIANKAVSNIYGFPKMVKKSDMPEEWLPDRQRILDDTVELMAANEKFGLGIKVSRAIYGKYVKKADAG